MSILDDVEITMKDGDEAILKYCWENWHQGQENKMIRTFHPVGHGAFYTETFYGENGKKLF